MTARHHLAALALAAGLAAITPAQAAPPGMDKISTVVVIYMENRGFDHMFGNFPGADGLMGKVKYAPQVDKDGKPYATLPPAPGQRFPRELANTPFLIDQYVKWDEFLPDLVHRYYQSRQQINGGRNDKFALYSNAGGLVMGYRDLRGSALWSYAERYTLADHFFMGNFGGSLMNHMWMACLCVPRFDQAPASIRAKLDDQGLLVTDGAVSPDGFVINTIYSTQSPHPANVTDKATLLPPLTQPTLGDRLSEKGVSWAWYSGGWNDAIAGHPDPTFQFHHQPYAYFARYADDSAERRQHLKDETDFNAAISAGTLPSVTFFKPLGRDNEHPGYATMAAGDRGLADLLGRLEHSPQWPHMAVIITYDENGGFWDHVAPPAGDRWGPGSRIPTLVISPYARRHFVDHTVYDTTSIAKFIERRWDLAPLGERDAKAADMSAAFKFK